MPCIPQLPPSEPCRLSTFLEAREDMFVGDQLPTILQLAHPQTCVPKGGQ